MIKNLLIAITASIIFFSCANDKKEEKETTEVKNVKPIDSTLVTDSTWGAITRNTNFEGLKEIFGADNVVDERICGPECVDSIDVTKVYKETNKELIIHWSEGNYHNKISMIESFGEGAPYHTSDGLKSGSTMRQLLMENGKPITFLGFGWDYGGNIISYNKGNLDSSNVRFRLDITGKVEDNAMYGDTELSTVMPDVKEYLDQIVVYHLSLFLNE